ncbi:hypothetical protein V5O48_011678 [Marasmius crinis-equi]|uniref:Uncharacterized protein n=1 Tax=Marasmius crinis-equi TaxID=585013 RepID=A0ABR3F5C1_9AGAR
MPDYPDSHSSPSSIPDSSLRELNGGDSPGIKRSGAPLSDPRPEKIRVICRPASRSSRGRASRRLAAKDEEIARARHEVNFLKESIKSVGSTHQEEKSRMTTEHQGKVHELKQRHILHLNQVLFEHKLRASSDLKAEDEAQETRMSSLQEDIEAQKRALSDVQKQFQRAIDNQITHEHLIDALCDLERQISKKRLTVVDRLNSNLHNDSNEEAALQLIQPKIDEIVQPYNYRIFDLETSLELSEQRVKDLHRELMLSKFFNALKKQLLNTSSFAQRLSA